MSDRPFKTSRLVGGAIALLLGIGWGGFVEGGAIVLARTQPQKLDKQLDATRPVGEMIGLLLNLSRRLERKGTSSLAQAHPQSFNKQQLLDDLKSSDSEIRSGAVYALGRLRDRSVVPKLLPLLKDPESQVRFTATVALSRLEGKSAIPYLLPLLQDKDDGIRVTAASKLGKLGDKSGVPVLLLLLKSSDALTRVGAASTLSQLGDKSIVPNLLPLLEDENAWVRSSAAKALKRLGYVSP